jgi:putative DNA primase/helicase
VSQDRDKVYIPVIQVQPDNILKELQQIPHWVVWKYEVVKGKLTKVPYNPRTSRNAAVDNPATWTDFRAALNTYILGASIGIYAGIGIVVTQELELTGVDLDHVVNGGVPEAWALKIVRDLDSYTERTPSGDGLRVLVRARKPGTFCKNGPVEIYNTSRFFTVTGAHLDGTPARIEKRQPQLEAFYNDTFRDRLRAAKTETTAAPRAVVPLNLADAEIIERAKSASNGPEFSRLWDGNWNGYKSQSEADSALCMMLAFWTGGDSDGIDRLFRQSGLIRDKWDSKRGQTTYGALTIAKACRQQTEHYQPPKPKEADIEHLEREAIQAESQPAPVRAKSQVITMHAKNPKTEARSQKVEEDKKETQHEDRGYAFTFPCGDDHYLTRWIKYAAKRTDAAYEYHEAVALIQLAAATPNLRAHLAQSAYGLAGNLYLLIIGDSTVSRKSTSARFAHQIIEKAIPDSLCADQMSTEGLIETLSSRPADSTTWYVDEFADLLKKLHTRSYMAGIEGLILNVYDGANYTHRRHTKRSKSGIKLEDVDQIESPHLSILGATTPSIFQTITHSDVTSGLLPRFAIVFPKNKPVRKPFFVLPADAKAERDDFENWLRPLHSWSMEKCHEVNFAENTLEKLDRFAAEIERNPPDSDIKRTMLERLNAMVHKLAMLVAAGHPGVIKNPAELTVTIEDAAAAIKIARRWQHDALLFAERIGQNDFERTVESCLRVVVERGTVQRYVIAKNAHVRAKILDDVRDTLVDRRLIIVNPSPSEGRPGELWIKRE